MSGDAIHDPVTDWTRKTFDKFIPGGGKGHQLLSELVFVGPGDVSEMGAVGKIAKTIAPDPGTPPALDPTPNPTNAAPQLSAAAADQRRARGRASTILTGGTGVNQTSSAKRTLLGV